MRKIVIIGAGPAGLTAGYELLKARGDFEIVILEESGRFGGISGTIEHHGNRMDIGGHRFFTRDSRINALWHHLMPGQGAPASDDKKTGRKVRLTPGGVDPDQQDLVMLSRRRVSRIYYRRHFFDYPVRLGKRLIAGLGFFTLLAVGLSYLRAAIFPRRENSLEDFYINRFGKKLYSLFFEQYTAKLWGKHPRNISADWGAQRVKGLSSFSVGCDMLFNALGLKKSRRVETSLINEFEYPKFGPGQLWETMAGEIERMGGRIIKNCRATRIVTSDKSVRQVECDDGRIFETDILISSMPLKDLVAGMNDVPEDVARIAAGLEYRDFLTIGVLLDRLAVSNQTELTTVNNIIPDCWIYVQDAGVDLGRIQIFNNWSPYLVKDPEHSVWVGLEYFCREGDGIWSMSDGEVVDKGVAELLKIGILSPDCRVLDFHVERVRKAYPGYFGTYSELGRVIDHFSEIGNLYCIGRNGQHRYNNMDHSMATAMAAVRNILNNGYADKSAIWSVNTDKEFNEEIKSGEDK